MTKILIIFSRETDDVTLSICRRREDSAQQLLSYIFSFPAFGQWQHNLKISDGEQGGEWNLYFCHISLCQLNFLIFLLLYFIKLSKKKLIFGLIIF